MTWVRPGRPLRRGWCLARGEVVLGLEGRVAVEHLEEEDAERPIVDRLAVPALEDQLGGEVPTGHTAPVQFQRMVGEYDFDTILNPAGPVNVVWNDFVSTSIAAARQRGMGVIGMKVMAVGEVPATDRALHLRYAMSQSDVAIVGMDTVEHVEDHVRVAEHYAPLDADEERTVMARALELVPAVKKKLWWLPEQRVAS